MANYRQDLLILRDREWLKAQRLVKTAQDLADELECHHGSITFACRVFSEEEKQDFLYARKHSGKLK